MSEFDIEVADATVCIVGEGPLWDHRDQSLYWVDVRGAAIYRLDSAGMRSQWPWPDAVGMLALASGGRLVVGGASGFCFFDPRTAAVTRLADPEAGRGMRQNDGKVDCAGRLWSGSLRDGEARQGRLWRLAHDGASSVMLDGLTISNGMAWSPDSRTMYFTDSPSGVIEQFDFDPAEGRIANRREFARVPVGRGVADGMTIDSDGCLWVAHAHGWCVARYTPDGRLDRVVNLPVRMVTSCMFGGADRDILYITTGTRPLSPAERVQQPLAGRLLAVRVGAKGLPEPEFGPQ